MERRKLLWQGLCALPLAWTPLGRARGDGVTVCGDRDFYRVLEDARMSNCWREYRDAYDLYQRALKLLPVNADSSLLAEILEDQKSLRRIFREAGDSLPRHLAAVKAAPESSEQRFWLAHTLHRMGRTAEASEQFQAVLSLPESDWRTGSWLALGWIHYRQGHYAEAIPYLDRVLGVETEKNRLHAASTAQALPGVIRQDLKRSIAFRERAAERLTRQAMKLIAADRLLQERFEALDSIPGVAQTSAIPILAELALLSPDLDVRQWVASAGLDPREHSSGRSVYKKVRISKTGNRHLRRALYMPALVAVRHDPYLRAFYEHLLAQGKLKMQALVAVMRKLLHAIFGMFKHHQLYDGSKVFQLPAQAPTAQTSTEAA